MRQSLLDSQLTMLEALSALPSYSSIELRVDVRPDPGRGASCQLWLIGSAEADDRAGARLRARALQQSLERNLPGEPEPIWQLEEAPYSELCQLTELEGAGDVAELLRRETLVAFPDGPSINLPEPLLEASSPSGRLFDVLETLPLPATFTVVLRPACLLPHEEDALRGLLSVKDPRSPGLLTPHQRQAVLQRLRPAGGLLVRAFLHASGRFSPAAALSVALALSGPKFEAGGGFAPFTVLAPHNEADQERLRSDLEWHLIRPAAAGLDGGPWRLRHLFHPREALALFRLPLPSDDGRIARFPFRIARPVDIPESLRKGGLHLGRAAGKRGEVPISLGEADRARHVYVVGQTGTGKSTLLREWIRQDIEAGRGVGVIDPHGELVEELLGDIPPSRAKDLVYFNPADTLRPIGLNLFDAPDPAERSFLVNEAVSIFVRLFGHEVFGPRLQDYFRNMALTLMEAPEGGALTDLLSFITDDRFRQTLAQQVSNPMVRRFWREYDAQGDRERREMIPFFAAKFSPFYSEPRMRDIVGQTRTDFRIDQLMNGKGILLANLAKGSIGEMNSRLLGYVLMARIQTALMSRTRRPAAQRTPFHLYVDEFQNFASSGFSTLLSEGRKYGLRMVLANQFLSQVKGSGPRAEWDSIDIVPAILGNVGSFVVLRVSREDASLLAPLLGPDVKEDHLAGLPNFNAVCRLLGDGELTEGVGLSWDRSPANPASDRARALAALSRLRWGRDSLIAGRGICVRARLELGAAEPDPPVLPTPWSSRTRNDDDDIEEVETSREF
jgi:hypothetical protein